MPQKKLKVKSKPTEDTTAKKAGVPELHLSHRSFLDGNTQDSSPSADNAETPASSKPILGASKRIEVLHPADETKEEPKAPKPAESAGKLLSLSSDYSPKTSADSRPSKLSTKKASLTPSGAPEVEQANSPEAEAPAKAADQLEKPLDKKAELKVNPLEESDSVEQNIPMSPRGQKNENDPKEDSAKKTDVSPTPKTDDKEQSNPDEFTSTVQNEGDVGGKADKPSPEKLKADAEAVERERKLEEYTETGQFFVPINAVAQKRSIKVSVGLTLLVLLLAIALIDLMLDTGMILLLQKVPHTHFFNLSNH